MGYYTDFEISIIDGVIDEYEFEKVFNEVSGYRTHDMRLNGVKWHDWSVDMKVISKRFPSVVFQLDGSGEEDGDVWRVYFKDGKKQSANTIVKVIHEDFDESKLKQRRNNYGK